MWYIYTMEYYSAIKKEWNNAICNNKNGPREYHIKWDKPDRERQISYEITYMWNLRYKWTYTQNILISTESKLIFARGEMSWGTWWNRSRGLRDTNLSYKISKSQWCNIQHKEYSK